MIDWKIDRDESFLERRDELTADAAIEIIR